MSHLDFRLGFEPGLRLGLMLQLAELDLELTLQDGIRTHGQAEPELESAWQPGTDGGQYEAAVDAEAEAEM